ncbi:hypothetical protein [Sphingomonas sp.]|uniref:helix-turn-helix transcriptional regulator n=1 Tax=Sphingomonas sp. TaxID=28214 RepID=UPI00286B15B2|nr:hypothetical protein [Sphingomonas sp.]
MILDRFSDTVQKLYAAAGDDSLWEQALHSIEDLTGSVGAVIGFVPKENGDPGFNLAGRFTAEQCATYTEQYQPICRRTRYMIENPQRDFVCDALLISGKEMDSDPVYDWFGQHDLRYFIGCGLAETRQYRAVFTLQRSPGQGHVQSKEIRLFKLIAPHVARAVDLADQLGTLRSVDRFSSAVLEALPQAVFALDGAGKLLFANTAAASVLAVADGLYFAGGKLRTRLASEQTGLDTTIREAALVRSPGAADGWVRVSRISGARPYAVFVAPLNAADEELMAAEAKVLVIAHDTAARACVKAAILTQLYGLTDAEARLASALSGGHSLESASKSLSIKPATAKSELKAVFLKMGVNRQQDLVRVLSSLAMLAAPTI